MASLLLFGRREHWNSACLGSVPAPAKSGGRHDERADEQRGGRSEKRTVGGHIGYPATPREARTSTRSDARPGVAPLRLSPAGWQGTRHRHVARRRRVADERLRHPGAGRRRRAQGQRHRQPHQHRLDADCRVPRLRHAGRLHHAGSRFLPLARDGERAHGVRRRHVPLRPPLLRLGLRIHVRLGQRLLRHRVLLPAERSQRPTSSTRRGVPGLLALPVRLRRHLLDHHLGRHDRPHRLRRRPDLQLRRLGLHLPDHRALGLGAGRLARDDGERRQLPPGARYELPRLRGLDGRAHASAASSPWPVPSCSVRASAASSSATAAAPCCRTT